MPGDDDTQIGDGDLPMPFVADRLTAAYDGLVTLELMPPDQPLALDRFEALVGA